ncbi:MAG: hypothetical protein J0H42_04315 [Rhizobiales bacterium]|nr:hypothetical protein [Hyphomicrobiales bacterium]
MKQSRAMSMLESILNIAIGFGVSLGAQILILPLLGVQISLQQNFQFALIMTVISVVRSYGLRRLFEALHIRRPLSAFKQAVIAERFRQVEVEGFDVAHDDRNPRGQMATAGACFALEAGMMSAAPPAPWPWTDDWWKPAGFRRDLVRAAALIIAEGEKFDRDRGRHRERER